MSPKGRNEPERAHSFLGFREYEKTAFALRDKPAIIVLPLPQGTTASPPLWRGAEYFVERGQDIREYVFRLPFD
jgi:hypothetical protein